LVLVKGEIVINRPVDEVFDFVADERNEPRFNLQMVTAEQVSAGPIGLGTQFRAQIKTGARTVEMAIEFTVFERPVRLGSRTQMPGMDIEGMLTFEPVGEVTRMRWSWTLHPHGLLRLVPWLVAFIGRRQETTIWTSLKHYLEAQG
jgi:hypothetical protein